ncbi:alpha/beta-hydrolase [Hypomontagnella monticulosa]|nr:alpha/beta-hydrolase [Hypomontagnella monticulosa]
MNNPASPECPSCAPVTVESGLLEGLHFPKQTRAFLGVPYGAPPVGDLRWRPPQRPIHWTGLRSAHKFGPSSLQFPPPPTSIYSGGESEFSEDCLYLNVYTGAEGADTRPVLVWFHFGAFIFGSASNPLYDGTNLAAEGVTVVTVNYRLGRFGFLAHPELSAESGYQGSGNYGIMDQIAALEWVQRNIKAFGGDRTNVTIGGASAGGASVHILRSSPLAKSLFSKAICESGPGVAPTIDGAGHVAAYTTLAAAEQAGIELLDSLGASSVAEIRSMPAEKIMSAHLPRAQGSWKSDMWPGSTSLSIFDTSNPIVDSHVLPESPLAALLSGKATDIPMLLGNVGNEGTGLPHLDSLADYHAYARETFGESAKEIFRLYPATTDSEVRVSTSKLLADRVFVWPMWTSARLQARNLKSPAWYYRFLREPPIPPDSDIFERSNAGAFHCVGVLYGFSNLDVWQWNWTDADRALAKDVLGTWAQFIRCGHPNGSQGHADSWNPLKSSSNLIKTWGTEPRFEALGARTHEVMAFWDSYYGIKTQI